MFTFREGEREGEIGEKRQYKRKTSIGCLPYGAPTWDETHTLCMWPEQEWNLQSIGGQDNAPTNLAPLARAGDRLLDGC